MVTDTNIWTNGLYVIEGSLIIKRGKIKEAILVGKIIDIKTPNKRVSGTIYRIGSKVDFPLYHTPEHNSPQFKTVEQIREEKIDSIL